MADEAELNAQALQFAKSFLSGGDNQFIETYVINRNDQDSGERIVIVVLKANSQHAKLIKRNLEESLSEVHKAVAGPFGEPCPMCKGTGRIA